MTAPADPTWRERARHQLDTLSGHVRALAERGNPRADDYVARFEWLSAAVDALTGEDEE